MKISKSKLEQIIREEVSNYLSNIYKWCPDGQKCPPGSEKTKWWKGSSATKDLDESKPGYQAGTSYSGMSSVSYKRDDEDEDDRYEHAMEAPLAEEDLEEVYSDEQRGWACAQKSDDFKGKRKLTKKQAAEMCTGPMKKKKKKQS